MGPFNNGSLVCIRRDNDNMLTGNALYKLIDEIIYAVNIHISELFCDFVKLFYCIMTFYY